MKTLFTGYNKVVRPVNHFSEPVVVTVGLQLIQLINVVRDGRKYAFLDVKHLAVSHKQTNSGMHVH